MRNEVREHGSIDGVKGGALPGLAALSENASPAQRGPRREKTKDDAPIFFSRRRGGLLLFLLIEEAGSSSEKSGPDQRK